MKRGQSTGRRLPLRIDQALFNPDETIVREGDRADRFYIIESGLVEGTQSHGADVQC